MKIEIDDDVIKATTKCEKCFSCLSGNLKNLCEVEYCVSNTVYFIKYLNITHCNYQAMFGDKGFCSCPTRQAIYNRYN